MSLNRTQSETPKDTAAMQALDAAGIKYSKVRFNTFHLICKSPGKNAVRYFPHVQKWNIYRGRRGAEWIGAGPPEVFIDWYLKRASA